MGADARGPPPRQPGVAEGGPRGPRRRAALMPRGQQARRADGRDLPRAHAAGLRREARRLGTGGERRHGAAAGDDLRRRRHATSSPRKASPTCCSAATTRSASRRSAAWPATPPVGLGRDKRMVENLRDRGVIRRPEDLGIDQAAGDARPAGGAVDQGSRARVGRALRAAQALPQLVRRRSPWKT